MKYIFKILLLCFWINASSQTSNMPAWVQLMHQPGSDIGDIRVAYDSYYKSHPFIKDGYTQEFKHLMMAHTRDNNGSSLKLPLDDQKFNELSYLQRTSNLQNSESSSSQWECIGPFDFDKEAASKSYAAGAAHVYTVEQSMSDPQILYAGSANAGVWRSNDKGLNWYPLTQGMMVGTVKALEIDYTDPNIAYFGGSGKVYKTIDGGVNWTITGGATFQSTTINVNDMVMSPIDHLKLWIATENGLYSSIDGGTNWVNLMGGIYMEIEFKPGDPSIMYVIKQPGVKTEFYKSTDSGINFTIRHGGYPDALAPEEQKRTEIAVTPAAPSIVYAFATGVANGGSGLYGIYVSHDEGENWNFQCCGTGPGGIRDSITNKNLCAWSDHGEDDGGQYYYDLSLAVSPLDSNEVHTCAVNHWVSYDGGLNFTCPSKWSHSGKVNYVHADIHDCHFYGNDWWWACDGGIFYSSTHGDTITRRQNGIEGTDFWGFGMGESDGDEVMVGGTYHNGTLLKDNDVYNNGWLSTMGGDNILGSVNYGYPRIIFSDYGKHLLSGDRNIALTQMTCSALPSSSYWIGEAASQTFSPFAFNTIYIAKDSCIWKSLDNGASYTLLHDFGMSGKVTTIEASWNNPNVLYAAFYPGWWSSKMLFKSTDAGLNWIEITPPNSVFGNANLWAPFDIAVSTEDDNRIWLVRIPQSSTYNNLNGNKVYFSSDGGSNWTNWTTAALNGEYITNIEYQRGTDAVYIGTRRAVYFRSTTMSDWQLFNNNLPASTTSVQLLIDYKKRKIRNATNRSVWECDLYAPSVTKATISVDNTKIYCIRDTVYFHDHSCISDSNASWHWYFPGGNPSSSTQKNPKVLYSAQGTYSVQLKVNDYYGNDSTSITNFITVNDGCDPEHIPGLALNLNGSGDYASVAPLNLNSNTITLMAWIKPIGNQNDWGGILFTRSTASTSGLSIKSDNEIRFHWNGNRWWIPTGLYANNNEWTHIAFVVTPDSSTVYVNGIGSTDHNVCDVDEFDANLNVGYDSYGGTRYFKGLIDEVCIYNRSLSQNEIRELMHLTKIPSNDLSLIAYYQFNELTGLITDRVGTRHATLVNGASRITSTGPFGGGSSYRTNITNTGLTSFTGTGLNISFPSAAAIPNGEVVTSRINLIPDVLPNSDFPSRSYWIMDNYGLNQTISNPDLLELNGIGVISPSEASNPSIYRLFQRSKNADGLTWSFPIDSADVASAGLDGNITFNTSVPIIKFGQLIALKNGSSNSIPKSDKLENWMDPIVVYPNPASKNNDIIIKSNLNESLNVLILDESGKEVLNQNFFYSAVISTSQFASGVYFYTVKSKNQMQNGKFIVN